MFNIIGSIIIGFIVGYLARAVLPGAQHFGFWITTAIGIGGSYLGGLISNLLFKPADGVKFTPAGILMSILGAIVLLLILGQIK